MAVDQYARIAETLATRGWALWPGFMPNAAARALRAELVRAQRLERLQRAGIGRGVDYQVRPDIRSDYILWLDAASPPQQVYFARMEALRSHLNEALLLGLLTLEAQFALYPPGAHYQRHRDAFAQHSERVLSTVLYLNRPWQALDGGQLRLYLEPPAASVDIAPQGGTLVLFLSDRFEHEVLPTRRYRFSIAGWFTRRPLAGRPV